MFKSQKQISLSFALNRSLALHSNTLSTLTQAMTSPPSTSSGSDDEGLGAFLQVSWFNSSFSLSLYPLTLTSNL